jgi:hypothetical protein
MLLHRAQQGAADIQTAHLQNIGQEDVALLRLSQLTASDQRAEVGGRLVELLAALDEPRLQPLVQARLGDDGPGQVAAVLAALQQHIDGCLALIESRYKRHQVCTHLLQPIRGATKSKSACCYTRTHKLCDMPSST